MTRNNKESQWNMFNAYFTDVAYAYPVGNNGMHTIQSMEMHATASHGGKGLLSKSEQQKLELNILGDKFFEF